MDMADPLYEPRPDDEVYSHVSYGRPPDDSKPVFRRIYVWPSLCGMRSRIRLLTMQASRVNAIACRECTTSAALILELETLVDVARTVMGAVVFASAVAMR
jgi:hypothetical protein